MEYQKIEVMTDMNDTSYPKIETLFERDETFKVLPNKLRNTSYGIIKTWQFTEKIDGTNIRIIWQDGKMKFGGRTGNAQLPADLIQHLYEIVDTNKLKEIFPETSVIIYGEGYGAGIQKGSAYSPNKQFIVFDVLVDGKWWLSWDNVCDIANNLNLKTVPYLGEWTLEEGVEFARKGFDSILAKAITGQSFKAEGIVGRTCETMYDKRFNRMIIKLKTKDF